LLISPCWREAHTTARAAQTNPAAHTTIASPADTAAATRHSELTLSVTFFETAPINVRNATIARH
jgi:hypothetical protein